MRKLRIICTALLAGSVTPASAADSDWPAVSIVAPTSLGAIRDMYAHVVAISQSGPFGQSSCTLLDDDLEAVAGNALTSSGFPKISREERQGWRFPSFYVYLTAHAHDPILGDPFCALSGYATLEVWARTTDAADHDLGDVQLLLWSTPTILNISKADERTAGMLLPPSQEPVPSEELNQQAAIIIRVLAEKFVDDWTKARQ